MINTLEECTVPEKILLAASQLEDQGQTPFSAEMVTVAAWQRFPKTFGLKGFADQFPDNNKVLTSIMGEKGLARRGWLVKMGQKLYALTRDGRNVVKRMMQDEAEQPHRPATASAPRTDHVRLSREEERFLMGLFEGPAVGKVMEGRKNELTFIDASSFWSITDSVYGEALDARVNKVRATLGEIDRHLGAKTGLLSNGRVVAADEVGQLCDIHAYLEERFARQLNLLRNRGEKAPT